MRPACIGLAWLALLTACHGPPDDAITGTGTLEVTEVDVSPTSAGHVMRVVVDEGQRVSAGDTLAALTQPTLSGDIDALRARVASAAATLRDLEQGPRPEEITRAAADLESARADAVRTTSDLARLTPLAARNIVSQQQLDAARAANVNAIARREAAAASVRLLRQGTREEQLRAARAELQNARASLAAALGTASDLVLTAPVSGTVLGRHIEPGEVAMPGVPALTIGDVAHPFVHVYVPERSLPLVHLGAAATATVDGFPNAVFHGRVVAINDKAEYTPRIAMTERERADLVFGVKVALDSASALKPGLPITVTLGSL
ncbi:MAG TPA: efflux RND transporter periplasmic adaptor subunit [Gemmatimonadaceae bacterium]|nr:efflux RND transporter periplasmic adaptor subunit [Gemmatimonadaceae bacterium]